MPDAPGAEQVHAAADQAGSTAAGVAQAVHDVAQGRPLPIESEAYVRANGAVQVGAGLLLATGRFPRAASTALAITLVPTTVAGHPFWELEGDERRAQRIHFLKNCGLLGGLILAAVDTEGRPGIAYRARHARDEAKAVAAATGLSAALVDVGHAATAHAHDLLDAARDSDLPDR
ncbi:MAG: DoxX family protein, partial [Actinobacteria bacterium]|nr:DoxX family protein [Actinomycetota bacterium]